VVCASALERGKYRNASVNRLCKFGRKFMGLPIFSGFIINRNVTSGFNLWALR
jgi:hypothetical protein